MGIWKVTRRVLPVKVVTTWAGVDVVDPPVLAERMVTVTLEGGMMPPGKLEPVRLRVVTPGWPAPGETKGVSVTVVWACTTPIAPTKRTIVKKIVRSLIPMISVPFPFCDLRPIPNRYASLFPAFSK